MSNRNNTNMGKTEERDKFYNLVMNPYFEAKRYISWEDVQYCWVNPFDYGFGPP